MSTLFWKYSHQLLKRQCRFTQLKPKKELIYNIYLLYFDSITVNKVTSKRCIMIRIVPIPTRTPLIIISVDPLQTLNIRLLYLLQEILHIFIPYVEFMFVVSHFPAVCSKVYIIDVFFGFDVIVFVAYFLYYFL